MFCFIAFAEGLICVQPSKTVSCKLPDVIPGTPTFTSFPLRLNFPVDIVWATTTTVKKIFQADRHRFYSHNRESREAIQFLAYKDR
jgi:hypothetical protein